MRTDRAGARELAVRCVKCGAGYPDAGAPFCCVECGGLYDFSRPFVFDAQKADATKPGLWKFRHSLSLPGGAPILSLGEGLTPLLWAEIAGRRVGFKCDFANPTASFKDRGMAVLCAFLQSRGVREAVEDSSGNAGAAFAAYAARAGIRARVFVPESASGPKREQIGALGADLLRVPGPRAAASEAALQAAKYGRVYASHAHMPFVLAGYATVAYELWEQAGEIGALVTPAGQGGLLLGIARGFEALKRAGLIERVPVLIGVQAQACAPLADLAEGLTGPPCDASTIAEGVRVAGPLRAAEVVRAVAASGGWFVRVPEADVLPGRDELARKGFYVEPTSSLVWFALKTSLPLLADPVVAMLTGSGFKVSI